MNRFLKLAHYEWFRFRKIYWSLLLLIGVAQFAGVFFHAQNYKSQLNEAMVKRSISVDEFVQNSGNIGFLKFMHSAWFQFPILLCIAVLLLYVFLIWYRDWFSRNPFIYRLLMLPASRNNVYVAKAVVMLFLVWGLVAFQLILLPLEKMALNAQVPAAARDIMSVMSAAGHHAFLSIVLPTSFLEFIVYYGMGIMGVLVVFTAILLERSYRWKGFIAGVVYCGVAGFVFLLPLVISELMLPRYLYANEIIGIEAVAALVVIGFSSWFSFVLLKRKINV